MFKTCFRQKKLRRGFNDDSLLQLPGLWNVSTTQPRLCFLLQNLGMALGWILLLLLARFEEDIEDSI